jgi:hypothetical protein
MAWCKVSSLTAATSRTLRGARFPLTRERILALASGKVVEGWEIDYFLCRALKSKAYPDLKSVIADLESWLEVQA